MRVKKAFPAIITKAQFRRVGGHLSSRAPKFSHPRRVGSSYLLSGLVKCEACKMPLTGRFAKSGKYSYYVCQSNINFGKDACDTPTLNARRFEELVVDKIRSDILTEGIIRELVKVVDEKMGGVAREQRKRLKTIEDEYLARVSLGTVGLPGDEPRRLLTVVPLLCRLELVPIGGVSLHLQQH